MDALRKPSRSKILGVQKVVADGSNASAGIEGSKQGDNERNSHRYEPSYDYRLRKLHRRALPDHPRSDAFLCKNISTSRAHRTLC